MDYFLLSVANVSTALEIAAHHQEKALIPKLGQPP